MIGRLIHRIAQVLAIAGGCVLIAMVVLTVVSVTGRGLIGLDIGLSPVPGDFELVELGSAFAIFSFLPWCQLKRGHVTVDLFVKMLGERALVIAELVGDILIFSAAAVIAWRLWLGMMDKMRYGETTYILGLPLWWGYAAAQLGALVFVAAAAHTAWQGMRKLRGNGASR